MRPTTALFITIGILAIWLPCALYVDQRIGIAIWLITSAWACVDSVRIGLSRYQVGGPNGPISTLLGCLLLWIVVFPWYLINKGMIARKAVPLLPGVAAPTAQQQATNTTAATWTPVVAPCAACGFDLAKSANPAVCAKCGKARRMATRQSGVTVPK